MRRQSRYSPLLDEFLALKRELFGGCMFAAVDDSDPRWERYNQLLGFFYPWARTRNWTCPKTGERR